jgi:uncharacterized repeat protein (TIGR01451 family)
MAGKRKWFLAVMAALGLLLGTSIYLFAIAPLLTTSNVRISSTGSDGNVNFDAIDPAVAYNSNQNEFYVVWAADDPVATVDGKLEIYGQRVSVTDGSNIGLPQRISTMGDATNALQYDAQRPAVVYNPNVNEYLVVWQADDDSLGDNEVEIYANRVSASSGNLLGSQIRVSHTTDAGSQRDALNTAVSYSTQSNRYLIVWQGDAQADNETEIYGALLDDSGSEQVTDFRISTMGTDGDASYRGQQPDVAYNSSTNEFYVVWSGDNPAQAAGAYEIYGRRLNAATGAFIGGQQRLSDMGSVDSDANFAAQKPAVAYSSDQNQYLVVWLGDDDTNGLDNKYEIYGQRVLATNSEAGNDTRISTTLTAAAAYRAINPDVAYDASQDQYKVIWRGDQNGSGLVDNHFEIFSQTLQASDLTPVGSSSRVSTMATADSDTRFGADHTAMAFAPGIGNELVVWQGDTDTVAGLADNEVEIFGRSMSLPNVDLAMAKSVDNSTPLENASIDYTIVVTNNGPETATGVEVTDQLPSGVTFSDYSATLGSYNSGTGVWDVGTLPNGQSATLTLSATVDSGTASTTITNTATITKSDQLDSNSGNNSADAPISIPSADLAVTKTVNNSEPNESGIVIYTVVVTSNGPDTATGVQITDLLPTGVAFAGSSAAQGSYNSGSGVWSVGTLTNGQSTNLVLIATVNTGTTGMIITNTAAVTAATVADLDSANNSASAVIAVGGLSDPQLDITTSQLTRSNEAPSCIYSLYHSLLPYSGFSVLVADMTTTTYPITDAIGGVPDYYYVEVDCGGSATAVSATVGEFSFTIVPGSP